MHREAIRALPRSGSMRWPAAATTSSARPRFRPASPSGRSLPCREGDQILAELGEQSISVYDPGDARDRARVTRRDRRRAPRDTPEQLSDPNDELTHSMTHLARARLALAAGDASAAEHWARGAVDRASRMDSRFHGEMPSSNSPGFFARAGTRTRQSQARAQHSTYSAPKAMSQDPPKRRRY